MTDGVLLLAHGTVDRVEDLEPFLLRIRRGRPPPPGLLAELRHRYEAIGGSPLLERTQLQASAVSRVAGLPAFVAMRLWRPELPEVLSMAATRGVTRLAVVPLAPFSVAVYGAAASRAREELAARGVAAPELRIAAPWGDHPGHVAAHAERILSSAGPAREGDALLLTAHSLPVGVLATGDPYQREVERCVELVAARLPWRPRIAWQSAGADGGPWLGPGLNEVLDEVSRAGAKRVVVAPLGFLAEHVETLYDLDVEARAQALAAGMDWHRVPALDAAPLLVETLADVARRALG